MSNDKLAATFGPPTPTAVVHLHVLYDAICHECGWESEDNPYDTLGDAERIADVHRCAP